MSNPQQQEPNNNEDAKRWEAEWRFSMRKPALMVLLEPPARQATTNIRIVKPEMTVVENYLINAASTGRLNRSLTDQELKQILLSLEQPKKRLQNK